MRIEPEVGKSLERSWWGGKWLGGVLRTYPRRGWSNLRAQRNFRTQKRKTVSENRKADSAPRRSPARAVLRAHATTPCSNCFTECTPPKRERCRGARNRPPARWRVRPWPRGGGSLRVRPRLDGVAWLQSGRLHAKGKPDGGQCASTHSIPWICGTSPPGEGTTPAGNAQTPRHSVQRYGRVSHMC